jgi:hypothetical protein
MKKPFLQHFSEVVAPVRIVQKDKSWLMRLIARALSVLTKMKIVDFSKEMFMNEYITTIGRTIYAGPSWSMDMEVTTTVLHELTHVLQFQRVWMEAQYLASNKWRSYYESSADQAWMIVYPERATDDCLERKATSFERYGIPRVVILEDLKQRRLEVQENRTQPEAQKVAYCFIEWDKGTGNLNWRPKKDHHPKEYSSPKPSVGQKEALP